jgi:hypothetical protein
MTKFPCHFQNRVSNIGNKKQNLGKGNKDCTLLGGVGITLAFEGSLLHQVKGVGVCTDNSALTPPQRRNLIGSQDKVWTQSALTYFPGSSEPLYHQYAVDTQPSFPATEK